MQYKVIADTNERELVNSIALIDATLAANPNSPDETALREEREMLWNALAEVRRQRSRILVLPTKHATTRLGDMFPSGVLAT